MNRLNKNLRPTFASSLLRRGYKRGSSFLSSSPSSAINTLNFTAPASRPDDLAVMIFGSSTDVGKTIISAGLSIAAMRAQSKHWKPAMAPHLAANMDDRFKPMTDQELLTSLTREMRTFIDFANNTKSKATAAEAKKKKLFTIVETAGGVLSPGPNKTLQADIYRSLRMPIVLVGDARLGGISSTVSAYESLRIRGYTVHAIVLIGIDDPNCSGNAAMLEEHFLALYKHLPGDKEGPGQAAWSLGSAPRVFRLSPMPHDQQALLHGWYRSNEATFSELFRHISASLGAEWGAYVEMAEAARQYVWWPQTHAHQEEVAEENRAVGFVESAHGDHYRLFSIDNTDTPTSTSSPTPPTDTTSTASSPGVAGRPLLTSAFDATASWYTQAVGHGNPLMSIAIGEAAGRYGHVLFPGNLHPPVVQLSRYLVEKGPGAGWAGRVFYSDNGSAAMDIALNMAFRLHAMRQKERGIQQEERQVVVLSQRDGYHGNTGTDTNSGDGNGNGNIVVSPPTIAYRLGHLEVDCTALLPTSSTGITTSQYQFNKIADILDIAGRLSSPLAALYREDIHRHFAALPPNQEIGALVVEPMMLRTGGLRFLDPLYQRILVDECRQRHIPVVFDEVVVGMYRLGVCSTAAYLQVHPDIASYGKMLSGGYVPLAATLATPETFRAFLSDSFPAPAPSPALQGHSYTANPIACTAALEAIRLLETSTRRSGGLSGPAMVPAFGEEELRGVSKLPGVCGVMGLGTVLSIQLSAAPPQPAGHGEKCLTEPLEDDVDGMESYGDGNHGNGYHGNGNGNGGKQRGEDAQYAALVAAELRTERVFARPQGNTVYLMTTPFTTDFDRARLLRVLRRTLTKTFYMKPTAPPSAPPSAV